MQLAINCIDLQYKKFIELFNHFRQCLSICGSRSPEAAARLGTSPVGLLGLACSATGTGIRARIFALQLLTMVYTRKVMD